MTDPVTYRLIKYADVLGKPLTKSLYRQLPDYTGQPIEVQGDQFVWRVHIHGRINYCPPTCGADTDCRCDEGACQRRPVCRTRREHQHVLLGAEGELFQSFLYRHSKDYDERWLCTDTHWQRYESVQQRCAQLKETRQQWERAHHGYLWTAGIVPEERQRMLADVQDRNKQIQVLEHTLEGLDVQMRIYFDRWVEQELGQRPIILLRG